MKKHSFCEISKYAWNSKCTFFLVRLRMYFFFGTFEPSGSVFVSGRPICPILLFILIQIQAGPTRGKTVEIRRNPWNFYVC